MNQLLCFAPEVLHVSPWLDDVVDRLGFDPRSSYVEDFWLAVLGPSTVWLLRRFAAGFDYSPDGFDLDLAETARSIGISDRSNRHAPFVRAVNRTVRFGLARLTGPGSIAVRRRIPPLTRRHLRHLSPALRELHAAWQEAHSSLAATEREPYLLGGRAPAPEPVLACGQHRALVAPSGEALGTRLD